ncbi:MAG: tetratricopeptide repeat protein [Acidobacteriota bacterium]
MVRSRNQYWLGGIVLGLLVAGVWWGMAHNRAKPAPLDPSTPQSKEGSLRARMDQKIQRVEHNLQKSKTPALYTALAEACMRKARVFHDGASYLRAERACQKALELDTNNYAAIRLIPWVQNGQHRFDEAVPAARRACAMEPKDPWNLGNLGDALLEIGEYESAAEVIQQMVDLRPDFASYSRASYVRELFGDPAGAIEIMGMAVRAANSRDPEQNAWSRVQLGNLYFNSGRYREARLQFQGAAEILPEYASAYVGLAKVQTAEQQFGEAVSSYRKSLAIVPTFDAVVGLGDLLIYQGKESEARKVFALLPEIEQHDRSHNIQPESFLSLFQADHDLNLPEALKTLERRAAHRKDIRTMDALAWAYYKSGRYQEALAASRKAMRLGTRDASFYYHFGMIQRQLGNLAQANAALQTALRINPAFHPIHVERARNELRELAVLSSKSNEKTPRES